MALLAPHRASSSSSSRHHNQYHHHQSYHVRAASSPAMELGEELEEGEARETTGSDPNYGPDLNFPHLEHKLTEVLGHVRKEFEGGVFPEKLGSKYGGYGTFLPTESRVTAAHARAPPPAPAWRHSAPPPPRAATEPGGNTKVAAGGRSSDGAEGKQTAAKAESSGEPKKTNSITLKFTMGGTTTTTTGSRGKNSAIYNGLGFSSPSVSEDGEDEDEEFHEGAESSPDRSTGSMLQAILSHELRYGRLLSPLPDLVTLKKEPPKEQRKPAKSASKKKDYLDDTLLLDMDAKHLKPVENGVRDSKPAAKELSSSSKPYPRVVTVVKKPEISSRYHDTTATFEADDKPASRSRRDETTTTTMEMSAEKSYHHPEKRKSRDAFEVVEKPRKKQKSNSSSGSFEMDAPAMKAARKVPPVAETSFLPPEDYISKPKEKVARVPKNSSHSKSKSSSLRNMTAEPLPAPALPHIEAKLPAGPEAAAIPMAAPPEQQTILIPEDWVECEKCKTWRLLPPNIAGSSLPKKWLCKMITWLPAGMNDCKLSEEETTAAARALLLPAVPAPLPPVVVPSSPPKQHIPVAVHSGSRKAEADLYPEGKAKPGKQAAKRKDSKSKAEGTSQTTASDVHSDRPDTSKRKKPIVSNRLPSKKAKLDEGIRPSLNEFGEDGDSFGAKTTSSRDYGGSSKKAPAAGPPQSSRAENVEREREEPVDARRSLGGGSKSKTSSSSKSNKGKSNRVVSSAENVDASEDWVRPDGKHKVSGEDAPDSRKKKGRSPRGLSPCTSSDGRLQQHTDGAASGYDRKAAVVDYRHSNGNAGVKDWDEGDVREEGLWDNQPDAKSVPRHYRDPPPEERERDRDGTQAREEKPSSRHSKRPEGRSYHESDEVKPKPRLKHETVEDCKYSRKDAKGDRDAIFDKKRAAEKEALKGLAVAEENNTEEKKETRAEVGIGGTSERKDQANIAIKAGQDLKHLADRLQLLSQDGATDIYLQAALKFLEGGALFDRAILYNDTAVLFRFCAAGYDRARDTVGAMLARKCAAVARFRMLMLNNGAMTRDRADLQAVVPRVQMPNQTTPPTGESPSSSSASDLDNLNSQGMPVDNGNPASGKGKSPVPGSGNGNYLVPPALQPTLARVLQSMSEVTEAFDDWNRANSLQAAVLASRNLTPELLASVERVGSIGFGDVETLVRLVNQVLAALGR